MKKQCVLLIQHLLQFENKKTPDGVLTPATRFRFASARSPAPSVTHKILQILRGPIGVELFFGCFYNREPVRDNNTIFFGFNQ